jgi:ATP-binding cassette, subfamily B, bacterial PglK
MENIFRLISILPDNKKKQGLSLLVMMIFMALIDMLGVASIMPLIAVLSNPDLIQQNYYLNTLYILINKPSESEFLLYLSLAVFCVFVLSISFRALTVYTQIRFGMSCEYSLSKQLTEDYLNQPYTWFLTENSADLGKNILSEISNLVHSGLIPVLNFISQGLVVLALCILLFFIDPQLTITIVLLLGMAYVIIYKIVGGTLSKLGKDRMFANENRFISINEAFGGIKEIKFLDLENNYLRRFSEAAQIYAKSQAKSQIIGLSPRYMLEALAFGGMLLVIISLMVRKEDFTSALPVIAVYAFAGYRLMPSLQSVYHAIVQLTYIGPVIERFQLAQNKLISVEKNISKNTDIKFGKYINLKSINYSYPQSDRTAIKNINIKIKKNDVIGFVGETGSGKTTLIDIILGLLKPISGEILIDRVKINSSNMASWKKNIGYVTQFIYLNDQSIAQNIALGQETFDEDKVWMALKAAQLDSFVSNELSSGIHTIVGERGARLSGGQKQRIGLARALYRNPKILVLDEATSALDTITEKKVIDEIIKNYKNITIIMIAHRISTLKHCDKIFILDSGDIKGSGSYEELIDSSLIFKTMADLGKN